MTTLTPNKATAPLTIANGAALSDAIALGKKSPVAFAFPITTSTAFSFEVSHDGGVTYQVLKDDADGAVTITKTAGSATTHTIDANKLAGFSHIKIKADTGNEGGERIIQAVLLEV